MSVEFDAKILRLKAHVGFKSNKRIAELLGMTDKALQARKRRDVFPDDKLFALSAKRPELRIDPTYIMTGVLGTRAPDATPPAAPTSPSPSALANVASTINGIALTLTRLRLDLQAFDGDDMSNDDIVARLQSVTDDVWRIALMIDKAVVTP